MEQLQEVKRPKVLSICSICGYKAQVYPFKDTYICKGCYYQT